MLANSKLQIYPRMLSSERVFKAFQFNTEWNMVWFYQKIKSSNIIEGILMNRPQKELRDRV